MYINFLLFFILGCSQTSFIIGMKKNNEVDHLIINKIVWLYLKNAFWIVDKISAHDAQRLYIDFTKDSRVQTATDWKHTKEKEYNLSVNSTYILVKIYADKDECSFMRCSLFKEFPFDPVLQYLKDKNGTKVCCLSLKSEKITSLVTEDIKFTCLAPAGCIIS